MTRLKSALITGSSRGIGLAVAEAFFFAGYNIALNCREDMAALERAAAEIMEKAAHNPGSLVRHCGESRNLSEIAGHVAFHSDDARNDEAEFCNSPQNLPKIHCFCADVSSYSACETFYNSTTEAFGHIDVLINNAAAAHTGLFTDHTPCAYTHIIHTNLLSTMHLSRLVLPDMVRRKAGNIINISSIWGERGASCEAAYAASKGGLNAFTKSLAMEYGPSGIRVNAIAPGFIDTRMNENLNTSEKANLTAQIGLNRTGVPKEIASLAVFLASDAASYINGAVIDVNGGM